MIKILPQVLIQVYKANKFWSLNIFLIKQLQQKSFNPTYLLCMKISKIKPHLHSPRFELRTERK
uniref:Putative ovule protein n=1 Tax=Solanum chacoense TaxID=4108 RepID=A0A0V0GKW9_SOLCH